MVKLLLIPGGINDGKTIIFHRPRPRKTRGNMEFNKDFQYFKNLQIERLKNIQKSCDNILTFSHSACTSQTDDRQTDRETVKTSKLQVNVM